MRHLVLSVSMLIASSLVANLSVYVTGGNPTCGNSTGYAIAQGSGGVPPYTYVWSTTATTDTITGLAPGTYSVTVTDANSDQASNLINLWNDPTPGYTDLWPGAGLHGCHGLCNNGLWYYEEYMPLNLVPPFSFSPEPIYGLNELQPEEGAWTGLCDGAQIFATVTDALGCVAQLGVDIFAHGSDPTPMSLVDVDPSCEGMNGGSITVNVGYEQSAYTPLWNSTLLDENMVAVPGVYIWATPAPGQNVATVTNRAPGDYFIERRFQNLTGDCVDLLPVTVPSLGPDCGIVNGNAFVDADQNCAQNVGESLVQYGIIEVLPGPYYATLTGNYLLCLPTGNYTLTQQSAAVVEHCTGGPIPFTVTAGNFVSRPLPDTSIVALDLLASVSSGPARPGFQFECGAIARNLTPTTSGATTFTLIFDPLLSYVSATPTPSSVVGNTITWNESGLAAWQANSYIARFSVPANPGLIGTPLITAVAVSSVNTDGDLANNTATDSRIITGSYDPNDKIARTSSGLSDALYFINEDEWIDYTIRFQNTGTDTAFNILLTDTLPATLDPATLTMGAASHPFTWELRDAGTLKFYFQNIQLPDSNYSEPLSHGFVSFRIRPRLPLLPGRVIENTANIFFDFNDPVITEPSVLTAEFSTGIDGASVVQPVMAYPNPANDHLFVNSSGGMLGRIRVVTMDGRIVRVHSVRGNSAVLDIAQLSVGAYVLVAETTDGRVQRLHFSVFHP